MVQPGRESARASASDEFHDLAAICGAEEVSCAAKRQAERIEVSGFQGAFHSGGRERIDTGGSAVGGHEIAIRAESQAGWKEQPGCESTPDARRRELQNLATARRVG